MGRRTIVVSDLHIDTWHKQPINGKAKHLHFIDFLDWCESDSSKVDELVINGDLMNLPPYTGIVSSVREPIVQCVLRRLLQFGSKKRLTVVWGNHDIGASGLRAEALDATALLGNISFYYPSYALYYPNKTILIEHGHLGDPLLWVYALHFVDKSYRVDVAEGLHTILQRRQEGVGLTEPITLSKGDRAYDAVLKDQQPLEKALAKVPRTDTWWRKLLLLWRGVEPYAGVPMMEYWWWAALARVGNVLDAAVVPVTPAIHQIFGHTHRADVRGTVMASVVKDKCIAGGVEVGYSNSGTWAGNTNLGNYLDIDEQGNVWVQDWIHEPESLRRLDGTQGKAVEGP
jgi:predicted phosphodiesterase